MAEKPTYEELEQQIQKLEQTEFKRKKVEKALPESNDQFRGIVEDVPGLICRFRPGGEVDEESPFGKESQASRFGSMPAF